MFVMVKCGVLFEVRTEFLYIIQMSFGCEGLKAWLFTIEPATCSLSSLSSRNLTRDRTLAHTGEAIKYKQLPHEKLKKKG
jgi:hypothetical protein